MDVRTRGVASRGGTYGIDKGGEVQEGGVEGDDAHGLEGVAVDDVARDDRVPDLDAGREQHERDLSHDPVIGLVDADAPDDQVDDAEQRGGIRQP